MRKKTPIEEIAGSLSAARKLQHLIDPPGQRALREMMRPSIVEEMLAAQRNLESFGGRDLYREALTARQSWEKMGGQSIVRQAIQNQRTLLDLQTGGYDLAATAKSIADWGSLIDRATLASHTETIGESVRMRAWASGIAGQQIADRERLYTDREFERVYAQAIDLLHKPAISEAQALAVSAASRGALALHAELTVTQRKLSMLAGTRDLLGSGATATAQAQRALLGDWHTRANLPQRFWRDPAMRERLYEEAEVDSGLASSDAGTALTVMISSGLAAGTKADGKSVAVFGFGGVSVTVQAEGSRSSAHNALSAFEAQLRLFIARKLEMVAGPNWFRQRVDGEIVKKAKGAKAAALKNGEADAPLIDFTDLGDLVQIILRGDNWEHVFGPVFVNRDRFMFETQTVIAIRRPTMHSRSVDGVRLLELMLLLQKLAEQLAQDGAWLAALQADD